MKALDTSLRSLFQPANQRKVNTHGVAPSVTVVVVIYLIQLRAALCLEFSMDEIPRWTRCRLYF